MRGSQPAAATASQRPKLTWKKRILFTGFLLLIAFVICELGVRLLWQPPRTKTTSSPIAWQASRPARTSREPTP